jgi:hypothetical protein
VSERRPISHVDHFWQMLWLRAHVAAVGVLTLALIATAGAFTFARPQPHRYALPPQPHEALPYSKVTYSARDALRTSRAANINLVRHTPLPIVDLSNSGDIVEVDVFGNPKRVAASGFSDYFSVVNGHWVKAPKTCSPGVQDAEQWRGNVRVIVSCVHAGTSASAWLGRVGRALAQLSADS